MLQRVAVGQARFNVPGLTADARGVVTGRQMLVRFASLDRLVSFLRLWSAEQVLDDVQPGLRLMQARVAGGTREVLVVLPLTSVAQADGVARVARVAGGRCFTGSGRQFVQYRDQQAPLGYDVTALEAVDDAVDFLVYGQELTAGYVVVNDLPLQRLLLRLDLQREPHGRAAQGREAFLLMVRRGLGTLVIGYLHRAMGLDSRLRVAAALCEPSGDATFQRRHAFWLLRIEELPPRLWGVLSTTPGLTLLRPLAENVAVAVGYRHPIHLGSCKQVFPADRLFLFGPPGDGVTVVAPTPALSPVADLVRLEPRERSTRAGAARGDDLTFGPPIEGIALPEEPPTVQPAARARFSVPLRLEAASVATGRAMAALVPWKQAGWIRSLCYALPPSALRGYRVAYLQRGLLIVGAAALEGLPFGELLHAPAPGLLVPLGWELRPAVSPEELAGRLGATAGALIVFPGPGEPPFRIPAEAIETLEARVLSDGHLRELRVEEMAGPLPPPPEPLDIEVENEPLGPMPLWRLGR